MHTPSGVATSCDYGILPFGPGHSGPLQCQNRITGDPRPPAGRYIALFWGRASAAAMPSGRKICGLALCVSRCERRPIRLEVRLRSCP
ncbi:hypothetical protein EOT10_26985 [Streptomyces antnestii]|uniref:Uncharacterized protein n=1 Tax=Streptomyces antnestii TaxID=2494256 RepID=A0A3S2WEB5_9ACTN|nr:hypothetical protein EOT10_26985 [Streptomyces sp. San01]